MDLLEKTKTHKTLYEGRIISLHLDKVTLPNGAEASREYITHPGGVCVAPLTDDNKLIFVRQYRYPYRQELIELPAGKLTPGEDPLECGKRELLEETGAVAARYTDMGKYYPSPGYVDEVISLYLAQGLSFNDANPDEDEFLEVIKVPLEQAVEMVMQGEIKDGKTALLILKTEQKRKAGELI